MSELDNQLPAMVDGLKNSLGGLRTEIQSLQKYGKANRRFIWIVSLSLFLDVVLTVGLAIVAWQAREANNAARQAKATFVASCQAGNETRRETRDLWDYLLNLNPHPTPAQQQDIDKIRAKVITTFAPRDCTPSND